jgi:cytochrome P450
MTAIDRFPLGSAATWSDLDGDPYGLLAELREREPVTWLEPLGGWAATRHATCGAILRDDARFETHKAGSKPHEIFGSTMLSTDDEEHRRHREPFEPQFRMRVVQERYTEMITVVVNALVDEMAPSGGAELSAAFASRLPIEVMRAVLGLELPGGELRSAYDTFAAALGNYKGDPAVQREGLATRALLDGALRGQFARMRGSDDLSAIGDVVRQIRPGLSEDEVVANALVILFGGIETVETLTLNTIAALLQHPAAYEAVVADPELTPRAIDEATRWAPPIGFLGRRAREDTELEGVRIEAGDLICAVVLGANRDPVVFPDPDAFTLDRPNVRRAISFSHGRHFCLGFNLAKMEIEIAIRALIGRLPGLRLADAPVMSGFAFRRPATLKLAWDAPPA